MHPGGARYGSAWHSAHPHLEVIAEQFRCGWHIPLLHRLAELANWKKMCTRRVTVGILPTPSSEDACASILIMDTVIAASNVKDRILRIRYPRYVGEGRPQDRSGPSYG